MANAKVAQTLSPFSHELNVSGTACASDCPACRWVELRSRQEQFLELLLPRAHARLLEAKLKPLSIIAALLFVFAFGVSAHAQKLPTLHDIETAQPHAGLDEYVTLSNCAAWSNKLPVDPSIAFMPTLEKYMDHMSYVLLQCTDRYGLRRGLTDEQTMGLYLQTIKLQSERIRVLLWLLKADRTAN